MKGSVCGLCGSRIKDVRPNVGYPMPRGIWWGKPFRVRLYLDGCWEVEFQ